MKECEGSTKATITIFLDNGKQVNIISKKPPVEVQCLSGGLPEGISCDGAYVTIQGVYEYLSDRYPGERSICDNQGRPGDNYSLSFRQHPNSVNRQNDYFSLVRLIRNGIDTGMDFPGGWYSAAISSIITGNAPRIIVRDATGQIYSKENQCNYSVACDDQCPPGHLRCKTINYPGYCCIPCDSTAAQIKAIKEQVRRFNRG